MSFSLHAVVLTMAPQPLAAAATHWPALLDPSHRQETELEQSSTFFNVGQKAEHVRPALHDRVTVIWVSPVSQFATGPPYFGSALQPKLAI